MSHLRERIIGGSAQGKEKVIGVSAQTEVHWWVSSGERIIGGSDKGENQRWVTSE